MKSLVFIFLCSIFLGSSAYLLNHVIFLGPNLGVQAPMSIEDKIEVLCLKEDGLPGDVLTKDDLSWCPRSVRTENENYLAKGTVKIVDLKNVVLTEFIAKKKTLEKAMLLYPHEKGYLGFLLGNMTRAKSVPVTNIEDYSTMLHRGDHIDLLFAYKNQASLRKKGEVTVKTLLKNVRILGIKGDYGQRARKDIESDRQQGDRLTLALSSRDAEIVTVAEQIGTLSILLRSPADFESEAAGFLAEEGSKETDLVGYRSMAGNTGSADIPSRIRITRGGKITVIERLVPSGGFRDVGLK